MAALQDLYAGQGSFNTGGEAPLSSLLSKNLATGLGQGVLAAVPLERQIRAQEDPDVVKALLGQARGHLNNGVATLQDIGSKNGLNASDYANLAALMGGNPLEGAMGWTAPKNQMHEALMGQANAANIANEYQKQKATADLQYGQPETMNMVSQDMANYNLPGVLNAMANPLQAAQINQLDFQNKMSALKAPLEYQRAAAQAGLPITTQDFNIPQLTGQRVQAGVGGVPLAGEANLGQMSPEQRNVQAAKTMQQAEKYRAVNAENSPEVIKNRLNAIDTVLTQASSDPDNFFKGNIQLNTSAIPKDVSLEDIATKGVLQDIQQKIGLPTTQANALTALAQLRNVPGVDSSYIDSLFKNIQATGQINMKDLQGALEGAKKSYTQTTSLAPIMSDQIDKLGNAPDRFNETVVQNKALKTGYSTPINQRQQEGVEAAVQGLNVPEKYLSRLSLGQGYGADVMQAALASSPDARPQMINNLVDYLQSKGLDQDSARKDAIRMINYYNDKNLGGMQTNERGTK